jgi:hypothetical protein
VVEGEGRGPGEVEVLAAVEKVESLEKFRSFNVAVTLS